jgi:uncharacterized protein YlxW (UPF0749 family)
MDQPKELKKMDVSLYSLEELAAQLSPKDSAPNLLGTALAQIAARVKSLEADADDKAARIAALEKSLAAAKGMTSAQQTQQAADADSKAAKGSK